MKSFRDYLKEAGMVETSPEVSVQEDQDVARIRQLAGLPVSEGAGNKAKAVITKACQSYLGDNLEHVLVSPDTLKVSVNWQAIERVHTSAAHKELEDAINQALFTSGIKASVHFEDNITQGLEYNIVKH